MTVELKSQSGKNNIISLVVTASIVVLLVGQVYAQIARNTQITGSAGGANILWTFNPEDHNDNQYVYTLKPTSLASMAFTTAPSSEPTAVLVATRDIQNKKFSEIFLLERSTGTPLSIWDSEHLGLDPIVYMAEVKDTNGDNINDVVIVGKKDASISTLKLLHGFNGDELYAHDVSTADVHKDISGVLTDIDLDMDGITDIVIVNEYVVEGITNP